MRQCIVHYNIHIALAVEHIVSAVEHIVLAVEHIVLAVEHIVSASLYIQKFINTPRKHLNHPRKPRQIHGEFDKSKVLITKSTGALRDIKTSICITSGVGITDFGFKIPWAPVLLVL